MTFAIIAKYLAPTKTKPSRIKVTNCHGQSITEAVDHGIPSVTQRKLLAEKLIEKYSAGSGLKFQLQTAHPTNKSEHILIFGW